MKEGGSIGLVATRAVALALLVLLYEILSGGVWTFFGSTFSIILSVVLLNDIEKLRLAEYGRSHGP